MLASRYLGNRVRLKSNNGEIGLEMKNKGEYQNFKILMKIDVNNTPFSLGSGHLFYVIAEGGTLKIYTTWSKKHPRRN